MTVWHPSSASVQLERQVSGFICWSPCHYCSWLLNCWFHAFSFFYFSTGLLCHLDDACVSNPCNEGAVCDTNPLNGRAICTCPAGFVGGACNQDMDECSIGNLDFFFPYNCQYCGYILIAFFSPLAVYGILILILVPAGANPCEHFGKCVNTEGSFQCQCGRGYAGPRCEIDINECLSMPCQNDATCLDRIGEFTCICMPGIKAWLVVNYSCTIKQYRTSIQHVVFQPKPIAEENNFLKHHAVLPYRLPV